MELNINLSEFVGVKPQELDNETVRLVLGDGDEPDVVAEWQPNDFPQYKVFTQDKRGAKRVFLYCRGVDLKQLIQQYGKDTKSWVGQFVHIQWSPQKENPKYHQVSLTPVGQPAWAEEKVQ